MKKILIALLTLLVIAGCSKVNSAQISDGDVVIFTSKNGDYTSKDLYEDMKNNDFTSFIISDFLSKIAKVEGVDIETVTKEAEEQYQSYIDGGLGDYIKSYYPNVDTFVKASIGDKVVYEVSKKDVIANLDSYVSKYSPIQAQIVYFDNEETAKAVIDEVNKGKSTFAMACTNNGYESEVTDTIYLDDDQTLDTVVKEKLQSMNEVGLSDIIPSGTIDENTESNEETNIKYYIINLVSKDVNDFKDEFVDMMVNQEISDSANQTIIINSLLEKHNFVVHDQQTYDLLIKTYTGIK